MKLIKLDAVDVGDRIRTITKECDEHINELKESIRDNGLLHPIVLRRDKKLIAGGCRHAAYGRLLAEDIEAGVTDSEFAYIPYDYFEDYLVKVGRIEKGEVISDSFLRKLEVEENVKRLDMTWQDQVKAIAVYHKLSKRGKAGKWGQQLTAKMLDISQAKVSTSLELAQELKDGMIPGLADCTSLREALRLKLKFKGELVADEAQLRIDSKRDKVLRKQKKNLSELDTIPADAGGAIADEVYSLTFTRKLFTFEHPDSADLVVFSPGPKKGDLDTVLISLRPNIYFVFHYWEDVAHYEPLTLGLEEYPTPFYWGTLVGSGEELEDGVMIGRMFIGCLSKLPKLLKHQSNNWEMNSDFQDVIVRLADMYVPPGGIVYLPYCEDYCADALAKLVLKGFTPFANVNPDQAEDLINETHERLNFLAALDIGDLV